MIGWVRSMTYTLTFNFLKISLLAASCLIPCLAGAINNPPPCANEWSEEFAPDIANGDCSDPAEVTLEWESSDPGNMENISGLDQISEVVKAGATQVPGDSVVFVPNNSVNDTIAIALRKPYRDPTYANKINYQAIGNANPDTVGGATSVQGNLGAKAKN